MSNTPSYIYCITNLVNGKKYVGKANNPSARWSEHKSDARKGCQGPLYRAFRKYGESEFVFEVIAQYGSEQEAYDNENYWIDQMQTRSHQHGYNCKDGGLGGTVRSEETLRLMSLTRKGKALSEETKKRISQALEGRKQSEEQSKRATEGLRAYLQPIKEVIRNDVSRLHNEGLNAIEIADSLGYSKQHVYGILSELGLVSNGSSEEGRIKAMLKATNSRKQRTIERLGSRVVEMRDSGHSWSSISRELRCDYKTAKRVYKEITGEKDKPSV